MGLPHAPQPLSKWIAFHDLTQGQVASEIGVSTVRLGNIIKGHVFPSPDEIAGLERVIQMPIGVMLDPCMLIYRDGPWPPPRGIGHFLHEQKLREQGATVDPTPGFYDAQLTWMRSRLSDGE